MRVALRLVGVHGLDLDGAVGLGGREIVADLEGALELGEFAAHGGDAHVLDGKADLRVGRVDGPGAGRDEGDGGSAHGAPFRSFRRPADACSYLFAQAYHGMLLAELMCRVDSCDGGGSVIGRRPTRIFRPRGPSWGGRPRGMTLLVRFCRALLAALSVGACCGLLLTVAVRRPQRRGIIAGRAPGPCTPRCR